MPFNSLPSFLSVKELPFCCRSLPLVSSAADPSGRPWALTGRPGQHLPGLCHTACKVYPVHALMPLLSKTGSSLLLECTMVYYLPINTYAGSTLVFLFLFLCD